MFYRIDHWSSTLSFLFLLTIFESANETSLILLWHTWLVKPLSLIFGRSGHLSAVLRLVPVRLTRVPIGEFEGRAVRPFPVALAVNVRGSDVRVVVNEF